MLRHQNETSVLGNMKIIDEFGGKDFIGALKFKNKMIEVYLRE